jgi:hypothetical protein
MDIEAYRKAVRALQSSDIFRQNADLYLTTTHLECRRATARCVRIHLASGWPFQGLFRAASLCNSSQFVSAVRQHTLGRTRRSYLEKRLVKSKERWRKPARGWTTRLDPFLRHQTRFLRTILASDELTRPGPLGSPERAMGHESQIEPWSPTWPPFCFTGFGTDRLRCQRAMKTAGRENQNRWGTVPGNRFGGAAGQNRSCSIESAAKQEKFQPAQGYFFFFYRAYR